MSCGRNSNEIQRQIVEPKVVNREGTRNQFYSEFLLELTVCSAQKSKVVSRCKRRNESGVDDEKVFDLISVDYCFILVSSFLSKHRLTFQPQIIPSITGSADDGAEIQHR